MASLLCSAAAAAEPPTLYTGAFRGAFVGAGPAWHDGGPGLTAVAGGRASTVLQLADVELRYQLQQAGPGTTHQLMATTALHPLFLFLLANNTLGTTMGSLALRLGLGPAWRSEEGLGIVWEWGLGLDVPLTEPDAGHGLWLGGTVTRASDLAYSVLEHSVATRVLLRLEYRLNGI